MLFDLQSRNRRTFVKVIYLGLAILMGGGLLLFGIGTGNGGGGLLDAFTGNGSSATSQVSSAEKRANKEVRLHPQDPKAWADLLRARYQTAGLGENFDRTADQGAGAFTEKGREKLRTVDAAWQKYLRLEPDHPDTTLARYMLNAYAENGLDEPAQASAAMEIITEQQPTAANYGLLAQYAYAADQLRKGDLAAGKAVELAPAAQRRLVRAQLAAAKRAALRQAAQDALRGTARTAPAPPPKSGNRGVG